jgi:hypothetical protein
MAEALAAKDTSVNFGDFGASHKSNLKETNLSSGYT